MFKKIFKIIIIIFSAIGVICLFICIKEPFYAKQIYNNTTFRIESHSNSIFKYKSLEEIKGDGVSHDVKKGGKAFYINKSIRNCPDLLDTQGKCLTFNNYNAGGSIHIYANAEKFNTIFSPIKEHPIGHIFFDENDKEICFKISKIAVKETGNVNNCINIQYPGNMTDYFDGFIIEIVSNGQGSIKMNQKI